MSDTSAQLGIPVSSQRRLYSLAELRQHPRLKDENGAILRRHVLDHALRTEGVEPIARIGMARVWGEEQIDAIVSAVRRTAERRPGRWSR